MQRSDIKKAHTIQYHALRNIKTISYLDNVVKNILFFYDEDMLTPEELLELQDTDITLWIPSIYIEPFQTWIDIDANDIQSLYQQCQEK